jgi:hypothetical protein
LDKDVVSAVGGAVKDVRINVIRIAVIDKTTASGKFGVAGTTINGA